MKIVTFGEIMLRLSKHGAMRLTQGNSFDANYGGSEANVAVSLAMLGDDVEYVTRVPDNAIGEAALMHLREYGVDVRHSVKGGKRLGTYYFEPSAAMRSSRVVYDRDDSAFNTLSFGDIDWAPILKEVGLFHCSGITCATSQAALDTTMDAVRRAFESGVELTCDINYRANLWKYPGANARKALDELMQYSSFIFGDQNEWYVASGLSFQHHVNAGVLWANGEIYTSRIYDIRPIVDQMGVGDAWVAAFIHARHQWPDDDRHCLEFSTAAASLKNTVSGDQNLVSEQEILAAMQGGNGRIDR